VAKDTGNDNTTWKNAALLFMAHVQSNTTVVALGPCANGLIEFTYKDGRVFFLNYKSKLKITGIYNAKGRRKTGDNITAIDKDFQLSGKETGGMLIESINNSQEDFVAKVGPPNPKQQGIVDALLKGVKTKPPEGVILPVLSASITGTLNDNTDQVLYCLRVFPFIKGTLLENVSPVSFKKNLVWIQLSIIYLYFGLQQWKVHDKYFLSLVDPNKSNFIISSDGKTLNMVDYGCLQLVTDGKPKFDCITYVSILCGGTTSLPVIIPTDLTPDTVNQSMSEIVGKLKYLSFSIDQGELEGTTAQTVVTTAVAVITLTQKQIDLYNAGKAQLPNNLTIVPVTSNKRLDTVICAHCSTIIGEWWSTIPRQQLFSANTLHKTLQKTPTQLCAICTTKCKEVLQSISKYQGVTGPRKNKYFLIDSKT